MDRDLIVTGSDMSSNTKTWSYGNRSQNKPTTASAPTAMATDMTSPNVTTDEAATGEAPSPEIFVEQGLTDLTAIRT